jgi:uncharacterized protein (TIGR02270 family)
LLILLDILEQHLEEAAMLSSRRMRIVRGSLQSLVSLTQLDRRIDAHLDGLRIDAENAWALCESTLEYDDPGEVFVGVRVALASGERERFDRVLEIACAAPEVLPGLIAALAWSPYPRIAPVVQPMLASVVAEQRYVAVAVHAAHRVSGEWIEKALYDDSPLVRARACRAVGELGRVDLISQLRPQFQSEDQAVAFWSCWSAGLLGDLSAVAALKRFISVPEYAERVLDIVLRRLAPNAAQNWLEELAQDA